MGESAGCSLSGCALERAFDQRSDERATVGGAGMDIVLRVDGGGGGSLGFGDGRRVDGSSVEDVFHGGKTQRPVGHADDADMSVARLATLVLVVENRGRRHGEVAAAPGEFLKSPAPALRLNGQADFDDDLVRRQRGRERSLEEIGGLDYARARHSDKSELSVA